MELGFCPSDASIAGTIRGSTDAGFTSIRWRYQVRGEEREAGGSAMFAPVRPGEEVAYLLPISSLFWRETGIGARYYQQLERYGVWAVGTQEDMRNMIREWKEAYDEGREWEWE